MEAELRNLIGKHGMRAVHEGLMKEMQDTFQYLHGIFAIKNEIVMPVQTVEAVSVIPECIRTEIIEIDDDSLADEEVEEPTIKQVVITNPKMVKPPVPPSPADVKQQKQSHRDDVEKKKQELLEKGIKPESLLTEANLKKWLGEGMSYMKIAKETGVHEIQVANSAKSFGVQSKISKYVAMKKKSS